MNEDQVQDLKQFIHARLSQSEASYDSKLDDLRRDLKSAINLLRSDMNNGFAGVADAIGVLHDKLDDHEERIVNLEPKAA